MDRSVSESIFERIVRDPDSDGGLTDAARRAESGNFLRHVAALSTSKTADGLMNPKLVLSWLVTHLGAGSGWAGLLVPVREAGALLPQLFTAARIRRLRQRKWAWAAGSAGEALAAGGIALAALTLSGNVAGAVIVGLLALLALARSVCSVSYKDVLGRTVGKTRRGTATGTAASVASAATLIFAGLLMWRGEQTPALVTGAVVLAAVAWAVAAAMMATMAEEPTAPDDEAGQGLRETIGQLGLLAERPQLARFVTVRSLLVGTALAPPYLVVLASADTAARQLGALVLASALASFLSSFVWGRLADRSSRKVLILSGIAGAAALGLALGFDAAGLAATYWAIPLALMALMVAYHGVRQARSTYLVDLAPEAERATYTAVSNTVVGLMLLALGGLGALVAAWSVPLALGLYLVLSLAGALLALGLDEVEDG